jgi:sugar phosphate isomerase/epimerase
MRHPKKPLFYNAPALEASVPPRAPLSPISRRQKSRQNIMKQQNSRRTFLKQAALLPLGVAVGGGAPRVAIAAGDTPAGNPGPKIKLSLNAWSYYVPLYKYIKGESGGMSLFAMLEECARLNFDAVDPTGYFFPGYPKVPERQFINEFKHRAFQLGLDISGTGIRNDFAVPDKAKRDADVVLTKQWIEVAAEMGAPVLRVFSGAPPEDHTWDEAAGWVAEALAQCAEHGEKYGVIVGVQNHGDMLQTGPQVIKLLDMVQSDWLGAIIDTGKFLTPDPYIDIAQVAPRAVNWQVKDLLDDRKGGQIDMLRLVSIIRSSNYRGYVPIETLPTLEEEKDKSSYDAYTRVPKLLGKLRRALEQGK